MPDTHFSSTELPLRRPIVYGTSSTTKGKEVSSDPSHTHKWTVYLRGLHGEDISYMIERVEFKLHETYAEHIRGRNLFDSVCSKAPYEVTETGWGEFEIGIAIFWTDPDEKSIAVSHRLQLYPSETNPIRDNTVINETYDEIEFHTPTVTIMEALKANPWNSLVKPYPSEPFGAKAHDLEQKFWQDRLEKILIEDESGKRKLSRLEQELSVLYDDFKTQ